jgi:YbbR domain-containing protein
MMMIRWFRSTGLRLLLALGLSLALWIFVSFSENPDKSSSFEGVSVSAHSLEPGLVIVDTNGLPRANLPSVNITVQADQQTLANNVQSDDIRAYIDLNDIGAGEHVLPIQASVERLDLRNMSISEITPSNIAVRLEQLITNTIPITISIQGNVPFSFERGQPQLTESGQAITQTLVTGPQGRVSQVTHVRAVANIEQLRADYTSSVALQALDEHGLLVEGVSIIPNQVSVRIPIRSVAGLRRVAVLGQVTGYPGAGYVVSSITSDPQLVNLTGSSGPLDAVSEIQTEMIDISGITSTITREVALLIPSGTSLQVGQASRVVITVEVERLSRPFSVRLPVPVQASNLAPGLLFSASPATIEVTLAGSEAALSQLVTSPLQANVDLSGLGGGSYARQPTISLPDGVQIVGAIPTVTVSLRSQAPPTNQPEPPDEPDLSPTPTPTTGNQANPTQAPVIEPTATPVPPTATPETGPETATPAETSSSEAPLPTNEVAAVPTTTMVPPEPSSAPTDPPIHPSHTVSVD